MKLIKLFKEILEEGTRRIPATNSFEVEVPDKNTGTPVKIKFERGEIKFGETDTGRVKGNTRTYRDFGAKSGETLGNYIEKIKASLKAYGISPLNIPGKDLKEQYAAVVHIHRAITADKATLRQESKAAADAIIRGDNYYLKRDGKKVSTTVYSGNEFYGIIYVGLYVPHHQIIDSPGFRKWRDVQPIGRGIDYLRSKYNINIKGIPGVDKMGNMDSPRVTFDVELKNNSSVGLYVWIVDGILRYVGKAGGDSNNTTKSRLSGDYGSLASSFPFGGSMNFKNNLLSNHIIGKTQEEAQNIVQVYSADLSKVPGIEPKDLEYYEQEVIAWAETKAKPSSYTYRDQTTGDLQTRTKVEKDKTHLSHRWNLKEEE